VRKRNCKKNSEIRQKNRHLISKDCKKTTKKCQQFNKHTARNVFRKIIEWLKNNLDKDLEDYYGN